jgi:hypothetical protein
MAALLIVLALAAFVTLPFHAPRGIARTIAAFRRALSTYRMARRTIAEGVSATKAALARIRERMRRGVRNAIFAGGAFAVAATLVMMGYGIASRLTAPKPTAPEPIPVPSSPSKPRFPNVYFGDNMSTWPLTGSPRTPPRATPPSASQTLTFRCADGSSSVTSARSGACSGHNGIARDPEVLIPRVVKPLYPAPPPTFSCADGTGSTSTSSRGACSHHGGIRH